MLLNLFSFFKGSFLIERQIFFPNIHAKGEGFFSPKTSTCLEYVEQGVYSLREKVFSFHKKFFFVFSSSEICILKEDGRELHRLNSDNNSNYMKHIHYCGKDTYSFSIFIKNSSFITKYFIRGPFKYQVIYTHFYKKQ